MELRPSGAAHTREGHLVLCGTVVIEPGDFPELDCQVVLHFEAPQGLPIEGATDPRVRGAAPAGVVLAGIDYRPWPGGPELTPGVINGLPLADVLKVARASLPTYKPSPTHNPSAEHLVVVDAGRRRLGEELAAPLVGEVAPPQKLERRGPKPSPRVTAELLLDAARVWVSQPDDRGNSQRDGAVADQLGFARSTVANWRRRHPTRWAKAVTAAEEEERRQS